MDDEAHVLARVAVGAAHQALVHEHRVRAAHGHVVDGLAHVDQTLHRAEGDAVVHGHDDGTAVFTIDDALQADFFAEVHGELLSLVACQHLFADSPPAAGNKKGRRWLPAAL